MKNTLILSCLFLITSCTFRQGPQKTPLPIIQGELVDLLKNPEDVEDEYVNLTMLETAQWLNRVLLDNPKIKHDLTSALIESERNTIPLSGFFQRNPTYSEIVNSLKLQEKEDDLKYKGTDYFLVVYSPNTDEFLKTPKDSYVIGVGESVDDDDHIIGFMGNKAYLVSESNASTIPTLIVAIGTDEVVKANSSEGSWNRNADGARSSGANRSSSRMIAVWDDYRINDGFRYERNGRSEVVFDFTLYENWNCPGYPSHNSQVFGAADPEFVKKEEELIKAIKKSDIENSQVFLRDVQIVSLPDDQPFNIDDHFFYITVYEYDWFQPGRTVQGCVSAANCTRYNFHHVHMKYINEWYFIDFCGFGFENSVVGDSFTASNTKCTLTIKRTE